MKKTLLVAALVALAAQAHAASILWGFGGKVYVSEDMTTAVAGSSYTKDVSGYLALVYIGQNVDALSDTVLSGLTSASQVDKLDYAISTSTKTAGKWNPASKTTTISSDDYSSGASFAVLFYNGSKYDYIYAGTTAVGEAVKSTVTLTDLAENAQSVSHYGAGSSSTDGIIAVPEPSVALLGLLGIGMLLKRRRA